MCAAFVGGLCGVGRLNLVKTKSNSRVRSSVNRQRVIVKASIAQDVWNVTTVRKDGIDAKKKVAIIGAGLGGLVTAMELLDAGHEVEIYDIRSFAGGKVGSFQDKDGNHIEMGLHVFFGCYYNLFDLMKKLGSFDSLDLKEHKHQFINKGGNVEALDFRMGPVGAPFNGLKAFFTTNQLSPLDKAANALALATSPIVKGLVDFEGAMKDVRELDNISFSDWFMKQGGTRGSLERMWDPIAYALGFLDCDNISARCMLTIFQLFAVRSEASKLRMLEGSPDNFLTGPIVKYIEERGGVINLGQAVRNIDHEIAEDGSIRVTGIQVAKGPQSVPVEADIVVAACDVGGIQRLLPDSFRKYEMIDNIYKLETVPVATVQLRFNGWVTELQDEEAMKEVENVAKARGLDNLLYSADADFSCFADLALTSPTDYYKVGEGSLLQLVLTPADSYIPMPDQEIAAKIEAQVKELFPSAKDLEVTWSNVLKLNESLYRERPGADPFRPSQETPIENFFLAGSYTYQDYIDSMEGAVKSGKLCAAAVQNKIARD
ncbi:hypothetical protein NDN08_003854 [Rhodosorus marinus]|uniref:Zeta-carotene desaturase, chloroplastic/chromoplastic n=1 Tax=Rhodosorus marinus TaxID=101924 RepID=A0AAV8UK55_9RHOD|nr:hypothetical protein NDN08_003854 [Rhodosorus marinus]